MRRLIAVCVALMVGGCAAPPPSHEAADGRGGALRSGREFPPATSHEASIFRGWVEELASPGMQGRGIGTAGLARAAGRIEAYFVQLGLEGGFANGAFDQSFEVEGRTTRNLAAMRRGSGALRDECVLVMAHYDHLGVNERGDLFAGADDNASGTAALLMLAERWAHREDSPGDRRALVFIAFSAEERGLLGARHLAGHGEELAFDLDRAAAGVNLDMVGRMRDRTVYLVGGSTAPWWESVIDAARRKTGGLRAVSAATALGAGDHQPFVERGIPALHLFTGLHEDYHQPTDQPWRINAAGGARVIDFADALLVELVGGDAGRYTSSP